MQATSDPRSAPCGQLHRRCKSHHGNQANCGKAAAIAQGIFHYPKFMLAMKTLSYRITLRKEPEGGYTVLVPALPGCVTYGKTVEEAIEMAKDAIRGYVESLVEDGEEIPLEEEVIECRLTVEAHA